MLMFKFRIFFYILSKKKLFKNYNNTFLLFYFQGSNLFIAYIKLSIIDNWNLYIYQEAGLISLYIEICNDFYII
jgi:hypothetical protein